MERSIKSKNIAGFVTQLTN